uniref:Uncharacterized protein n=1 Tax=Timema tahoe TaxID=61484 RepID=A0A7R9IJC4_9NEOP|nr:unnamed protein product [Timema tahoe]
MVSSVVSVLVASFMVLAGVESHPNQQSEDFDLNIECLVSLCVTSYFPNKRVPGETGCCCGNKDKSCTLEQHRQWVGGRLLCLC